MSTDWLPSSRADILAMALLWKNVLSTGNRWEDWEFQEEEFIQLNQRYATALAAFNLNKSAARGPVTAAAATAAFKSLTSHMRDIKRRRFTKPPLTDADFVSLDLKPEDTNPTTIHAPEARPVATVKIKGAGTFDIKIEPEMDISGKEKSYWGCKIVYEVFEQGAAPPTSIKQLDESIFIRKKKETFVFQPEDSGKKAWFAIRYENSKGEKGPWCPMFSVLIP